MIPFHSVKVDRFAHLQTELRAVFVIPGPEKSRRRRSRTAVCVLALTVLFIVPIACEPEESIGPEAGQAERAEVVRVVDGDTIIVEIDGDEERVRYIGIDAPESVQPEQPVECFGPEAADANADLVDGETVYLLQDVSDRDRFGRLLRYVYVDGDEDDGTLVNLELVRNGYAEAVSYEPDVSWQRDLDRAEREARDDGLGMWGSR